MSILDSIVEYKKKEVDSCRELVSINELEALPDFSATCHNFKEALINQSGIIAEFKRKSPSKGIINAVSKVEEVVKGYALAGASAVSVLTDFNFFGGSLDDLQKARKAIQIPILRKEFIIDEYQLIEAKAHGADAILLIAAILDKKRAGLLAKKAHDLGLQVLMEIHEESELDVLNEYLDVVGVNNRNLKTFEVNLHQSIILFEKIPKEFLKISESGISSAEDIVFLKKHGFHGFLIGENFMKTEDPAGALREFNNTLSKAEET